MKKILNWSIGSFFRTLGRIIAYLVIAFLIFAFFSKSDILNNLLFMNVNASTYTENIVYKGIKGTSLANQSEWTSVGDYWKKTITSNSDLKTYTIAFDDTTKTYLKNYDFISFNLIYTKPNPYTEYNSYNIGPGSCVVYSCGNFQNGVCTSWGCDASANQFDDEVIVKDFNFDHFNFNIRIIDDNYNWYSCTINGNEVICPTSRQNVKQIRFDVYFNTTETRTIDLAITRNFKLYNSDNVSGAINNQTQQQHQDAQATQDAINGVNDSITNSDTSEATNSASDLFNNHQDNDFGLSGVITAPLNLIRSLTSKTCSQLVLPIPFVDKDLKLPCLSAIYREHFNGILSIYQIVLFAIVGYRICISIFFMVKGFKDPNKDEIEVMDL